MNLVKKLLILFLMLCLLIPISAAENEANALYSLGLIKGYDDSGKDFRLANKLTRAESIVQIVRFLGAEKEALTNNYKLPFDDVPDWAYNYIGYAYENGITSGRSATKFDPNGNIDAAQFLTLILRAMDYSDKNGDFTWSAPFELSQKIGLSSAGSYENFTRGDAFVICYNALLASKKDGSTVSKMMIEKEMFNEKALEYANRIANGEILVVACVGDSITEGHSSSNPAKYSYPAQLQKMLGQGFKVVNCGKSSSYVTSPDSEYNQRKDKPELWYPNTAEYKELMASGADIVIVMLGTNDARNMTSAAAETDFTNSYKAIIKEISSLPSSPDIYLSTNIPAVSGFMVEQGTVSSIPKLIRLIGKDMGLPVIETGENLGDYYRVMLLYNDMVHPTDISYPALAINFYNEVFGHSQTLPEVQKASGNVVFVSDSGKLENDGTSPQNAVDKLATAVAMLRDNGGTVVICGPLTLKETYLVKANNPITITSLYDGVDYRKNGAKLTVHGNLQMSSDLVIENVDMYSTLSAPAINCRYNNLTIGEGVSWSSSSESILPMAINAGTRVDSAVIAPEEISCYNNCNIMINSGSWSLVRGGNFRMTAYAAIGNIAENAKVAVIINGGDFPYTGGSATSASGMNNCDGEVYMEINGGTFKGNVVALHNIGANETNETVSFYGTLTMKITDGTFGNLMFKHSSGVPDFRGTSTLILSEKMSAYNNLSGFDHIPIEK